MTDRNYRDLFFGESYEYLREINKALVRLEKTPDDIESINLIFRLMHTLKGMAATMEYNEVADFAHCLEDVFSALRAKEAELFPETMDVIFECIDAFSSCIDELKERGRVSLDIAPYKEKLKKLLPSGKERGSAPEMVTKGLVPIEIGASLLQKLKSEGHNVLYLQVKLSQDCE